MTEQLTHRPYNLGWPSVGREQISQDGMFRLSPPMFCKYWLCNSWDHLKHCNCTSQGTCLVMRYFVWPRYMSSAKAAALTTAAGLCPLGQPGEGTVYSVCWYGCSVSQARGWGVAAGPARREYMRLKFLRLFEFSFGLWARASPALGSMNSAHSEVQKDNWCHEQDEEQYIKIWHAPPSDESFKSWWPVHHLISPCCSKGHLSCLNY